MTRRSRLRGRDRERGQAAVETALVAPMSVFMILGILQLGQMQQAHLLTEYAAFCAARAGIVHHGNPKTMKEAAFLALMPTFTRVYYEKDTLAQVIVKLKLYQQLGMRAYLTAEAAKWEDFAQVDKQRADALGILAAESFDFIKVDILAPTDSGRYSSIGRNVKPGTQSQEIDFDDVSSEQAVASNVVSIRLTYYYLMRVPFANWVIHNIWTAHRAGVDLLPREAIGQRSADNLVEAYSTSAGGAVLTGAASGESPELRTLRLLNLAGLYVIPLKTTYTMRMQSNQFQKFMP